MYNQEYNVTRELTITPSRNWGGEGMLGCVLGFGALHRLPAPLHEPIQAPGEMLFDSDQFPPTEPQGLMGTRTPTQQYPQFAPPPAFSPPPPKGDFITPMMTGAPPPPLPSAHAHGRHKPRRPVHTVLDMDDYLKEGEQKSKELDGRGAGTGVKGFPPPPKGAPPPPRRAGTPAAVASHPPTEDEATL